MTPADRATLARFVQRANRNGNAAWGLLIWMGTRGFHCELRFVPRIPAWVCAWAPDGTTLLGEAPEPAAAVLACARRVGEED